MGRTGPSDLQRSSRQRLASSREPSFAWYADHPFAEGWEQLSRSVNREVTGCNASERTSPEIDRVVRRPTLSLKGEGSIGDIIQGEMAPAPPGSRTYSMLPSGSV